MKNLINRGLLEVAYRSYGNPLQVKTSVSSVEKTLVKLDKEVRVVADNIAKQFGTTVKSVEYSVDLDGILSFKVSLKDPKRFDTRRIDLKALRPLGLDYKVGNTTRGKYQFTLSVAYFPKKWKLV